MGKGDKSSFYYKHSNKENVTASETKHFGTKKSCLVPFIFFFFFLAMLWMEVYLPISATFFLFLFLLPKNIFTPVPPPKCNFKYHLPTPLYKDSASDPGYCTLLEDDPEVSPKHACQV